MGSIGESVFRADDGSLSDDLCLFGRPRSNFHEGVKENQNNAQFESNKVLRLNARLVICSKGTCVIYLSRYLRIWG